MRIAIIYDVIRWEEKDLVRAIRELGHTPILLHVTSFFLDPNSKPPEVDVAINRCVSHSRAVASAIFYEEKGIPVINSAYTLIVTGDKLYTTMKLVSHNIPTPRTLFAFTKDTAIKAAEKLGYPVVIKPIIGSWGRLIAKAYDRDTLESIIEHREYMHNPQYKIHYIQEYINKPGRDLRIFAIGDKVPLGIYRVSQYWKTNTALGGKAVCAELNDEMVELTLKAARAVGGGVLGVDIFEDSERGYLVDEVNGVTEYKNTVRVCGKDVSKMIVNYVVEVARK